MKKNKGITLIALVITIIVLLILAGVTINAIVGNQSSMEKAKEARTENEKGNELDTIKLAVVDAMAKGEDGQIKLTDLNASLSGLVTENATGDSPWTVTGNAGYKYRITSYGEVTLSSTVDIVKNNQIVTGKTVTLGTAEVGNALQLTAQPTPDVTVTSSSWSSSNTSVATIDNTGLVTIVAEGQTTITLIAVTSIGNITKTCTIKVGDSISYTTTLNGVTLDNWKVFYVDGNYTYIIYGDYLPNSAVSSTIKTNYNLVNGKGDYSIKSLTNRKDLMDAMTTTSNWADLINNGSINGIALSSEVKNDINVKAKGSPTLDLYVNSWNAKYLSDKIYTAQTASAMSDGFNGYYLSITNNPPETSEYEVQMSTTTGYSDALYYPHTSSYEECGGYWLASPSGSSDSDMMRVHSNGSLDYNSNGNAYFAFRPVICLPSSILQ